jgi:hypothetical protein
LQNDSFITIKIFDTANTLSSYGITDIFDEEKIFYYKNNNVAGLIFARRAIKLHRGYFLMLRNNNGILFELIVPFEKD